MTHKTFEPNGRAWNLGDDYKRHVLNGRPEHAQRAKDAMVREMLDHGATAGDVYAWEEALEEQILDDTNLKGTAEVPDDPNDYVSFEGNY